jgi:acetate---CoA ligase (ADP-forming)
MIAPADPAPITATLWLIIGTKVAPPDRDPQRIKILRVNTLESLLRPRSVAVIGASEDINTFAGGPVYNLLRHGYTGRVFPVNPSRPTTLGLPTFRSVLDIPEPVDTAIVVVPTRAVLGVLHECVEKKIASATIITSGFSEEAAGPEGLNRAAALEELIRSSGMRVIGPNSIGMMNLVDNYVPRAANNQLGPGDVRSGPIALITQSGACGNILFNQAQANGVGVGLSVATGDQVDVTIWDLTELALGDQGFQVVIVVAETLGAASDLERVAARAHETGKLVLIVKLGKSDVGRQAVMTHSGSIAGDAAVQSAAMRQLGIVEVEYLEDLWQIAGLVEKWGLPGATSSGLGVVSFSGGEGAFIADRCAEYGVDLTPVSDEFSRFVKSNFEYAMASNPFDPSGEIIGRPEKVRLALGAFIEQNDFADVLIASPVLSPDQARRQLADIQLIAATDRARVALSYWSAGGFTDVQRDMLNATSRPVFSSSTAAIRSIAGYYRAGRRHRFQAPADHGAATGTLSPGARYFGVREAMIAAAVEFTPAALARSAGEASAAATELGYPLVMKANVVSSVHKSANGLVRLGLADEVELASAFDAIAASGRRFSADGVVVERMAAGEIELLIGATRDPQFGAVIVFGAGGTSVEFLEDTALLVARYSDEAAIAELVRSTRIGRYLSEVRPAVAEAVDRLVASVASWFAANEQLQSLDLNPLKVDLQSASVLCVDCRVS